MDNENKNTTFFIVMGVVAIIVAIIITLLLMDDASKKKEPLYKAPVETVADVTPEAVPEPEIQYDYNAETTYDKPVVETNITTSPDTSTELQVNSGIDFIEYVVQKNDSLYGIAKKRYGSSHYWALIYKKNHIKDPDKIYVGQTLLLPISGQGNSAWDTKELVDTYVDIYKTYRTLDKVEGVYFMLLESVKRIDPEQVTSYLKRIRAFDHAFANRTTNDVSSDAIHTNEEMQKGAPEL